MNKKMILLAAAVAMLGYLVVGIAADVDNGRLQVKPYKSEQFRTGAYIMGKMELFGYVGDLKEREHLTGIVLRDGNDASAKQKHLIAVIAKSQKLSAFIELDDKVQPLVDPQQATTAAPPNSAASSATDGK